MNIARILIKRGLYLWGIIAFSSALLVAQANEKLPNVIVWDTVAPLGAGVDVQNRHTWQAVPTDLLRLESQHAAAVADPSYYGRAYAFKGNAVIENPHAILAFSSQGGRVIIYTKRDSRKQIELVPLQLKGKDNREIQFSLLQNTGDEVSLKVSFSGSGVRDGLDVIFSVGRSEIISVHPEKTIRGMSVAGEIAYGVAPHFIGDDLIIDPHKYPSLDKLCIPCENLFLGLLKGQESVLVLTWPPGQQALNLVPDQSGSPQGLIGSVEFRTDGKAFYLALLTAAGIWHQEPLQRTYLERDIKVGWQRPFPAKWKTQLLEGDVRTTFVFKESKQKIWRGVIGHYTHPVWFEGDAGVYRLSKKIPPKGRSIVYFTERNGTPSSVSTPVDIMKDALGRATSDAILDIPGRVLRTHHRRGPDGIRRACTCGCTATIEAVFKEDQEVQRQAYVEGAVDDMVYFVERHVARIEEYQAFARDIIALLKQKLKSDNRLKAYVVPLVLTAEELREEYERARDHMKTLAYTNRLARQTKALTRRKKTGNLQACLELGKQWRAMGAAQDDVIAQSHRIVRKLFQQAGYGCVETPQARKLARDVMTRCRQCLRNPDGYEIWPNY